MVTALKKLVLLLALLMIISPVLGATNFTKTFDTSTHVVVNTSYTQDTSNTTPWEIWLLSGLLGIGLVLWTLKSRNTASELEADAIVSVIAWVPLVFCSYTSFTGVSRMDSYGVAGVLINQSVSEYVNMVHYTIYHFEVIGILAAVAFILSIVNTYRIATLHGALKGQATQVEFTENNQR